MMQIGYRPQLRMPNQAQVQHQMHHHQAHQMQMMHQQQQAAAQMNHAAAGAAAAVSCQMPGQPPPNMPMNMAMPPPNLNNMMNPGEMGFDGKMLRKSVARKTVDYNPSIVKYLEVKHFEAFVLKQQKKRRKFHAKELIFIYF
jgi:hypothetical protein